MGEGPANGAKQAAVRASMSVCFMAAIACHWRDVMRASDRRAPGAAQFCGPGFVMRQTTDLHWRVAWLSFRLSA